MKTNLLWLFIIILAFLIVSCDKDDSTVEVTEEEPDRITDTLTTPAGVQFVRTPDVYFDDLPDWPYSAKYVEIDGLRQAYAEDGPADGEVVLLLHGQPSWSYLYRKMIPVPSEALNHLFYYLRKNAI